LGGWKRVLVDRVASGPRGSATWSPGRVIVWPHPFQLMTMTTHKRPKPQRRPSRRFDPVHDSWRRANSGWFIPNQSLGLQPKEPNMSRSTVIARKLMGYPPATSRAAVALGIALAIAPTWSHAETRVRGTPQAVVVEAQNASVKEILV